MMNRIVRHSALTMLVMVLVASALVAQTTDTTMAVSSGMRLRMDVDAGKIDVHVWDRDAVQIHGVHQSSTAIRPSIASGLVFVSVTGRGVAECDCTLTVPRWMPLTLRGGDTEIRVTGTESEVIARNYSGNITINGGRDKLGAESTLGEVTISNAHGRVTAKALNAPIRITDVDGDVEAEGSSSHVYLTRITSHSVTASTVGGVVNFSGHFFDDGHYRFATHMGSIFLTVPEPVNARINVSTVSGALSSTLPHTREEGPRRGRFTALFGSGTANVETQTFAGGIVVRSGT
jgi:hypothetical protein